jgi:hypothetical protein
MRIRSRGWGWCELGGSQIASRRACSRPRRARSRRASQRSYLPSAMGARVIISARRREGGSVMSLILSNGEKGDAPPEVKLEQRAEAPTISRWSSPRKVPQRRRGVECTAAALSREEQHERATNGGRAHAMNRAAGRCRSAPTGRRRDDARKMARRLLFVDLCFRFAQRRDVDQSAISRAAEPMRHSPRRIWPQRHLRRRRGRPSVRSLPPVVANPVRYVADAPGARAGRLGAADGVETCRRRKVQSGKFAGLRLTAAPPTRVDFLRLDIGSDKRRADKWGADFREC